MLLCLQLLQTMKSAREQVTKAEGHYPEIEVEW